MTRHLLRMLIPAVAVLGFAAAVHAAEPLELQTRPESQTPQGAQQGQQPGRQPSSPQAPQSVTPQPVSPTPPTVITPQVPAPQQPTAPTVIVPVVPVPVTPDTPKAEPTPEVQETPAIIVPVLPVTPDPEKPAEVKPETPAKKTEDPLTPGAFLPTTPEPEKKAAVKPEKKEPEKKAETKKELPRQAEAKPDPRNPKKGDPLQIPEDAKKDGDLSFLEGCWVGTRPEYHTKRIVTERFCFGKDGVGKRFIIDPGYAGQCVGATRALLNQGGVLRMQSEQMYCTDVDDKWGASEMTCQGEGEHTPCTWVFHDVGGAKQSYSIRFVRE